jgi:hypothetical protein
MEPPPYFLYAVMRMLKVIEVVWSVDRESFTFCTWQCACKKYKRCLGTSIGDAYCYLG